jgi:hypothetical protein
MATTVWKKIISFRYQSVVDDLEISNAGYVRKISTGRLYSITQLNRDGHVVFRRQGREMTLHGLVAETFIGPREFGMVVDHKDANKFNNCLDNLQYLSIQENSSKGPKTQEEYEEWKLKQKHLVKKKIIVMVDASTQTDQLRWMIRTRTVRTFSALQSTLPQ